MNLFKSKARYIKYYLMKTLYLLKYSIQNKKKYKDFIDKNRSSCLFITHNLGGGTEQYYKNYLAKNKNIIKMTNVSYLKSDIIYIIEIGESNKNIYLLPSMFKIFLQEISPIKIIVNSLVSYYKYNSIIDYLARYKIAHKVYIEYMFHDFHSVCPTVNLVYSSTYCEMRCIENGCRFNFREHSTDLSILKWREEWESFFKNADELHFFSQSSKAIFISAYPLLAQVNMDVTPHDMSYFKQTIIKKGKIPFHVGIIGSINSIAKGKHVVSEYLRYAKSRNITTTIVGEINKKNRVDACTISYLGKYDNAMLGSIIERHGISVVLFPSICPETFSYLISEIIELELPIACFNLGAQGEKVEQYKYGCIIKGETVLAIQNALHCAYERKYGRDEK
jgi:hypothetical protein